MVVVSQIDQETNGEVRKRMMEHLMANIGCASSDIVLFSSYTHESEEKDFVKDRLALHVLLEVQKRTDAFLAHLANR